MGPILAIDLYWLNRMGSLVSVTFSRSIKVVVSLLLSLI